MVASHFEPVGKHGRLRLRQQRYVASFGPAEEAGLLSFAAAGELGATEARRSRSSWGMALTGAKCKRMPLFPRR